MAYWYFFLGQKLVNAAVKIFKKERKRFSIVKLISFFDLSV